MPEDAIFVMASSTKPVLGVAAMILIDEGLIHPSDPVEKYIPEFADMQVAVLAEPRTRTSVRSRSIAAIHRRIGSFPRRRRSGSSTC